MIGWAGGRIWLHRTAADLRGSFDKLSGLVRNGLKQDPLTGDLFVFVNRRMDLLKALYWDRDGFALWCKRLEKGRFVFAKSGDAVLSSAELALLLEGAEAVIRRKSPRFHLGDIISTDNNNLARK
jgi:transposase